MHDRPLTTTPSLAARPDPAPRPLPATGAPPSRPTRTFRPDVCPSTTRVLLALLAVHARDGRATVRTVARASGRSTSGTHGHLLRLRALGLVAWDPSTQATLRPLVAPTQGPQPAPPSTHPGEGAPRKAVVPRRPGR